MSKIVCQYGNFHLLLQKYRPRWTCIFADVPEYYSSSSSTSSFSEICFWLIGFDGEKSLEMLLLILRTKIDFSIIHVISDFIKIEIFHEVTKKNVLARNKNSVKFKLVVWKKNFFCTKSQSCTSSTCILFNTKQVTDIRKYEKRCCRPIESRKNHCLTMPQLIKLLEWNKKHTQLQRYDSHRETDNDTQAHFENERSRSSTHTYSHSHSKRGTQSTQRCYYTSRHCI